MQCDYYYTSSSDDPLPIMIEGANAMNLSRSSTGGSTSNIHPVRVSNREIWRKRG